MGSSLSQCREGSQTTWFRNINHPHHFLRLTTIPQTSMPCSYSFNDLNVTVKESSLIVIVA